MVLNNEPPQSGGPFHEQDYFPIFDRLRGRYQQYAVSFNYILRTGDIHLEDSDQNQTIQLGRDDAFTKTVDEITKRVIDRVRTLQQQRGSPLHTLFAKRDWDKNNREQWESILSEITSEEMDKVPVFDNYFDSNAGGKRPKTLNLLSADIKKGVSDNNDKTYQTDCEVLSAVGGVVMQRAENFILDPFKSNQSWKNPMNYYAASGGLTQKNDPNNLGLHTGIVAPTGNWVDFTSDPDKGKKPYFKPINDYSIEKLARGESMYYRTGQVFGSYKTREHKEIRDGSAFGIAAEWNNTVYARDGSFGIALQKQQNGNYNVHVTQQMDAGGPHKRQATIYMEENISKSDLEDYRYEDWLTGYTYRFRIQNDKPLIERYKRGITNKEYWQWNKITGALDPEKNPSMHPFEKKDQFRDNHKGFCAVGQPEDLKPGLDHDTPRLS